MQIEEFLEEDDRYLQLIVVWLELKKDSYVYIGEIDELLGLSRFKVKKFVDNLADDLSIVSTTAHIKITENGQILTSGFDNLLVKKLTLHLLKRSMKFHFFMEVLIGGMSFEHFCATNFISRSTLYKIRKEVNMSLKKKRIKISNNQLKGLEEDIRNFTFSFLYTAFGGLESPFTESLLKEVGEIVSRIILVYDLSLSTSENDQLTIFIGILNLRKYKKISFSKVLSDISEKQELGFTKQLFSTLTDLWDEKRSRQESCYLEVFLFCKTQLAIPKTKVREIQHLLAFTQLEDFTSRFLNKVFSNTKLEVEMARIFHEEIVKLLIKTLYFDIEFDSFFSKQQLLFFKESYPVISQIVSEEVRYIKRKFSLTPEKIQRIYYDFLFFIVNSVPLKEIEKEIYICVDFAQGRHYTGVISKQILGFKNLSLKIEHAISAKTQLYVSDVPIATRSIAQIIWKNPPTPTDWREFGDKLIELKGGEDYEQQMDEYDDSKFISNAADVLS